MIYSPSLDAGVADGFYDLIDGLVGDIFKQTSKIGRLAKHSGQETYQVRRELIHRPPIYRHQCQQKY